MAKATTARCECGREHVTSTSAFGGKTRRFELRDEKSSKFWEIALEGVAVTVRFGKNGTNDKLILEKTGKGYAEGEGRARRRCPVFTIALSFAKLIGKFAASSASERAST